jgi:hypothetical protein
MNFLLTGYFGEQASQITGITPNLGDRAFALVAALFVAPLRLAGARALEQRGRTCQGTRSDVLLAAAAPARRR